MNDHIKKLVLKNWLSYKKGVFDFHPGVNMIIGPSDHGKSAVMDALRKVIENRPMGDEFQSWWGGETFIGIHLDNSIIKYRKEKQAVYQIKDIATKKVTNFKAFRAGVPQEITELLRLNRKINIQRQLEKTAPIFLLSESPPDVARHLNEVANLTNIDTSLDIGKKDLSKDVKEKGIIEKQIKEKEKELYKFKEVDALKILVILAEKIKKNLNKDEEKQEKIEYNLNQIIEKKEDLKDIKQKLKLKPKVDKAFKIKSTYDSLKNQEYQIEMLIDEIVNEQEELNHIQNKLTIKSFVRKAVNFKRVYEEYELQINQIKKKLEDVSWHENIITDTSNKLKEKRKEFKKIFPDICPLCNSKVERSLL